MLLRKGGVRKRLYRQDGLSNVKVNLVEDTTLTPPPPINSDGHVPGVLRWRERKMHARTSRFF